MKKMMIKANLIKISGKSYIYTHIHGLTDKIFNAATKQQHQFYLRVFPSTFFFLALYFFNFQLTRKSHWIYSMCSGSCGTAHHLVSHVQISTDGRNWMRRPPSTCPAAMFASNTYAWYRSFPSHFERSIVNGGEGAFLMMMMMMINYNYYCY